MAPPNYEFEKRKRDLAKKAAKEAKRLRKLEKRGLHQIRNGRLFMRDVRALARLADLYGDGRPAQRPLV